MHEQFKYLWLLCEIFMPLQVWTRYVSKAIVATQIRLYQKSKSIASIGGAMTVTSIGAMGAAGIFYARNSERHASQLIRIGQLAVLTVLSLAVRYCASQKAAEHKKLLDRWHQSCLPIIGEDLTTYTLVNRGSPESPRYEFAKLQGWNSTTVPSHSLPSSLLSPPSTLVRAPQKVQKIMKVGFYGVAALQGNRTTMEDMYHIELGGYFGNYYGVFDGHAGRQYAQYAANHLHKHLAAAPWRSGMPAALINAFKKTHDSLPQVLYMPALGATCPVNINEYVGTTAVVAVTQGAKLFVAHVGDSRAVLCRGENALPLTVDHTPLEKSEIARIEKAEWRILQGCLARPPEQGTAGLEVSRALGDKAYEGAVICTPDVCERVLTEEDKFMILASDGLWGKVSNEDAVGIVSKLLNAGQSAQDAAEALTEAALKAGSSDNITAIVIPFVQADELLGHDE